MIEVWLQGVPAPSVIVEGKTGVVYHHQYGGTDCNQAAVEGFLVPVFWEPGQSPTLDSDVPAAIKTIPLAYVWCGERCVALEFDAERERAERHATFDQMEAFLAVKTPWGPGWLIWENSD